MEKDGKLIELVYHHPKYHTIPHIQSSSSSGEVTNYDQPLQVLFLCPTFRWEKYRYAPYPPSPLSTSSLLTSLYWCNNKEFNLSGGCSICNGSRFGKDYYFCDCHHSIYHKECVESPARIKHPYHPEHSLQLYYNHFYTESICLCCGRGVGGLVYECTICKAIMHVICAMKSVPFIVGQPKSHHHPLTFFPRQTSLICNVCGLLRKIYPTYICARCNFVAHNDCMYSPRIIKISRHHHRISYISYLPSGEWSCGVCRKSINNDYGSYTCVKCGDYVVHTRCAVREDVRDGIELEGVPEKEEDDITQDAGPFENISDGVILHFLHNHHLCLEVSVLYDENKLCQAFVMPIFEGNFYSCMECEFILHETCANARRRIHHPLLLGPVHYTPIMIRIFNL